MGDLERGRLFLVAPKGHRYQLPATGRIPSGAGSLEALASPNEALRYLGYRALQAMPGEKARQLLADRLADRAQPAHQRARAFWAAASLSPNPAEWIRRTITDQDPLLRGAAIRACRVLDREGDYDTMLAGCAGDSDPQVRAAAAIALRFADRSASDEAWAAIAQTYRGKDRWFLEALGIGAELRWPSRFAAYLKATGDKPHADLVWRARCAEALPFLEKLIVAAPDSERDRFMRALHFHPKSPALQQLALGLFRNGSPQLATMVALEMLDPAAIESADEGKRLEELTLARRESPDLVALATRYNQQSEKVLAALLEFIVAHRNDNDGANAARHLL
ncbi:MAG: hypothetical protein GWO24_14860, partial [Akkermansiaceae bacterium]|nr:hypothetical protein [Akkermansiaceae bacterium]NIV19930.1 hypothetical protein [Gammaproteobacteria bacterium]